MVDVINLCRNISDGVRPFMPPCSLVSLYAFTNISYLVCLTGKKKQILCPYCTETCSTNWNLRIHIQRKHSGKAKPATPGSYATSTQFSSSDVSNMPTTNDRHYYHPDNNNGSYHQTYPSYGHFSELDSKKLKESSSFKKKRCRP